MTPLRILLLPLLSKRHSLYICMVNGYLYFFIRKRKKIKLQMLLVNKHLLYLKQYNAGVIIVNCNNDNSNIFLLVKSVQFICFIWSIGTILYYINDKKKEEKKVHKQSWFKKVGCYENSQMNQYVCDFFLVKQTYKIL